MEQIKECPYCGSRRVEVFTIAKGKRYYVGCECSAAGPIAVNDENAITFWNAAAIQIEQLRKERDEITQDYNAVRIRADRLDAEMEPLRYELAGRKAEAESLRKELALYEKTHDDDYALLMQMKEELDEARAELDKRPIASLENLLLMIENETKYKDMWYKRTMETVDLLNEASTELEQLRKECDYWRTAGAETNKYWKGKYDQIKEKLIEAIANLDEARRVARRLYATNKYLIKTFACQPVPIDKTYQFVYDTHAGTGYVVRNDKP